MFSFRRKAKPMIRSIHLPPITDPTEKAIDTFLLALRDEDFVDYQLAYESISVARSNHWNRAVQLWTHYHNALAYSDMIGV